jgi:CRP/FNR family cyclic AMP-dependent transcriptional regulator
MINDPEKTIPIQIGAQARARAKSSAPDTLERVLLSHPLLHGCEPLYIHSLLECASNVTFNNGEVIFRQGEEADQFYLIRQGRVVLEISTPGCDPITLQTVGEGDFLGWSWMITPYRWHFDARAVELTRAILVDGICIRQKCDADHDFGFEVMRRVTRMMEQRLQATRLQVLDIYGIRSDVKHRSR